MTADEAAVLAHLCFLMGISLALLGISSKLASLVIATRRLANAAEERNELWKKDTEREQELINTTYNTMDSN